MLKIFGCWESASENVLPPCTESANLPIVLRKTGSGSCLPKTVRPRSKGSPESINVANCRVKIISVFGLIVLRSRKGMSILISFFNPAPLAFGALADDFPRAAALAALPASTTLVG